MLSKASLDRLEDAHEDLQLLAMEVDKRFPCVVVCTHRTREDQDAALAGGFSKLAWPGSKHNLYPSYAIDLAPRFEEKPFIRWEDIEAFKRLGAVVKEVAKEMGLSISWGGDWERFKDYPHFELRGRPTRPVFKKPPVA